MHDISVAAVALLLTLGCKGDSEKSPPADQPQQQSTAEQAASQPAKQPPINRPPTEANRADRTRAPIVEVDCEKLMTAADLEEVCDLETEWKADPFETGKGPTSCSRRAGPNNAFVRFAVGVYPHGESARAVTRGAQPGSIKLERRGVGGGKTVLAHARKGNVAVTVSSTRMQSATPPCSDDQLGKLAMIIDSRLP